MLRRDGEGMTIAIDSGWAAATLGESIAVNGCCLTVTDITGCKLTFQAGPETLVKTNLGLLKTGDRVNLERALRMGDPLGGHIVTGHVDAVGTVLKREVKGDWHTVWFECPANLDDLLVHKGSIAVDGVSLTLAEVDRSRFSVMLIPHTLANTTLGFKTGGDTVNLEADLIAKHVQKLFANLSIEI